MWCEMGGCQDNTTLKQSTPTTTPLFYNTQYININSSYDNNNMMGNWLMCPRCYYKWLPRVEQPKCCPKCKQRIEWSSNISNVVSAGDQGVGFDNVNNVSKKPAEATKQHFTISGQNKEQDWPPSFKKSPEKRNPRKKKRVKKRGKARFNHQIFPRTLP